MKKIPSKNLGFTLIEILLVISLIVLILTIVTTNLFNPVSQGKLDAVLVDAVSIIREAQNKAMNSDTSGQTTSSEYGVHFESNKYILFKGTAYNPSDSSNFVVNAPSGITIIPNLPCPSPPNGCANIVFQKISGEVASFNGSQNSVCIIETSQKQKKNLLINFVGVVNTQDGC